MNFRNNVIATLMNLTDCFFLRCRYHCHTCKMVDGVGVCTVCAKVCHKDHEISYAKYGSFFCDCGAKEDGSCQVRPNASGHHGKRTTAVTLVCKSFPH